MFDNKKELSWKRTGKGEYPKNGEVCLIYFTYTGFSISQYVEEPDTTDYGDGKTYMCHDFVDAGGFLGGEDLLWIPVKDLPPFGSYSHIALPMDYECDRKFMKWNDPRKISRWVELTEDFHWVDKPGLTHRSDIPKGTTIGVIGEYEDCPELIGVFHEADGRLNQCFVPKDICKDAAGVVYGPLIPLVSNPDNVKVLKEKYSSIPIPFDGN